MRDYAETLGILSEAAGLLGGLLSFLGATGIVLFAVSLIFLALIGAFSPLPKLLNYLAIVGLVTGLALFGVEGFGELPGRVEAVRGYLVLMLGPVVLFSLLSGIVSMVLPRRNSETGQLREAVTELTEQVAQLRREQRTERPRETLTLRAQASEPRMLRRIETD